MTCECRTGVCLCRADCRNNPQPQRSKHAKLERLRTRLNDLARGTTAGERQLRDIVKGLIDILEDEL